MLPAGGTATAKAQWLERTLFGVGQGTGREQKAKWLVSEHRALGGEARVPAEARAHGG